MKTKNPMQLKAFVKRMSVEKKISAQVIMQNYMMERLLERISLSNYKHNFILKGGFLIAAIIGLDNRATMDLDATVKGFNLTHKEIREIFDALCKIEIDDDIAFSVTGITDIRETDDYPGIRVSLEAKYPPLRVPLSVDITTGDIITPQEIEYTLSLIFDDRKISVWAYNLETILAEKLETILSRNIANTRPRDFYDVHILNMLRGTECNFNILKIALQETTKKRGSENVLTQYRSIMESIRSDKGLKKFWLKYQKDFNYADEIAFEDTCDSALHLLKSALE